MDRRAFRGQSIRRPLAASRRISYLQSAKDAGYTHAHIWVAPPKQGDDYIFYAHPDEMVAKRMGLLKLKEWYERMLDEAKKRKVIDDYQVTGYHCHHRHHPWAALHR